MKLLLIFSTLLMALQAEITLPTNFESNFTQTITNHENAKVLNYEGSVLFKAMQNQSLFKWNYTLPTQKEVCTNGYELTIIDHDLEQVSLYAIEDGINLEAIVQVAKKVDENSYKATYKKVEYLITLDKKSQLNNISYIDNMDNAVSISFTKMKYNQQSFDLNKLDCIAPKDYDVVKG